MPPVTINQRACLLALAWAVFLISAPSGAEAEVSLVDSLGRTVTLPRPPQRIIPLFSSNSEIVAALGLMDRIVGVDAMVTYPPAMKEKHFVGGRLGFSLEAMAALEPDLVIMAPSRQAVHLLLDPLERLGVPTAVLASLSLDSILENIQATALLCGEAERGRELAETMRRELADLARKRAGHPRPRVVMINGRVGEGLLLVTRRGTYTADIIEVAGGRLALDEAPAPGPLLAQVSPEAILAADPDLIIYTLRQGLISPLPELLAKPGWRDIRAVRNGQVYVVPSGEFLIPGPRVLDGARRLADLYEAWENQTPEIKP